MNLEQKEWRSVQIAATILYRCLGNIQISQAESPYYDLLVTIPEEGDLRFGVEIKSSTFTETQAFSYATRILADLDYTNPQTQIPIILMCVNESAETATFSFLIGWNYGYPKIYRKVELRKANKENFEVAKEALKYMDNVIRVISENNWTVLKRIGLTKELGQNRSSYSELLYLRAFSSNYCMKQKQVTDEKEKLERLIKGIPEEEYPSDELDDFILNGVRTLYPDAKIKSSLILLSSDVKDIQILQNYWMEKASLMISPNILNMDNAIIEYIQRFQCIRIPLEIYGDNPLFKNYYQGEFFEAYSPNEGWLERYPKIKDLAKNTLRSVSTLFIR